MTMLKPGADVAVPLSAADLTNALHDIEIRTESIAVSGPDLVMFGVVDLTVRWMRLGRYKVRIAVPDVSSVEVNDDSGTGQVLVDEVRVRGGQPRLLIESGIPGEILIETCADHVQVTIDRQPALMRRWFRWQAPAT